MGDGQLGAEHCTVAAIEQEQLFGNAVAETLCHAPPQIMAHPCGAKPLAFNAQERDLVKGIYSAQPGIEL
jgi:hypothetical protein